MMTLLYAATIIVFTLLSIKTRIETVEVSELLP